MIRIFTSIIASVRYLFIVAVLALAVVAVGSLGRGVVEVAGLASGTAFDMRPGSGAGVVPWFIRAAFLYFLATALCSLFVAEPPVPQWMQVKNLFQLRVKVLAFVAVILPLAFMGRVMTADLAGAETLYSGAGVFLVLAGIFLLVRFGAASGDEEMSREGTRVLQERPRVEHKPKQNREIPKKEPAVEDPEKWLRKQKEDLRFQKESLGQVTETGSPKEGRGREDGSVTVRPGPRRPRGRRR